MTRPWTVLDSAPTPEGLLELRQRGEREFMIRHGGRVLMTSVYHRSEVSVAELGCAPIRGRTKPRVLVGGAGLGYTLRAVLDALPRKAAVTVAELNPVVLRWCAGPLSVLTDSALSDSRVRSYEGDVMEEVRRAAQTKAPPFDAIVLDLYIGPDDTPSLGQHPLYGKAALEAVHDALTDGGSYAVWGEEASPRFERGLRRAGFEVRTKRTRGPGPHHVIFLATKLATKPATKKPASRR